MTSNKEQLLAVEAGHKTADILDKHLGPFCGSIYLTALGLFPTFNTIREAPVHLSSVSDVMAGGVNPSGQVSIHIGLREKAVTPALRSRIVKRFGLPPHLTEAPARLFLPFVLAHEIGHVIQADSEFESYFGHIDSATYVPEESYDAYINSDRELNADYIAALIVGNSELGAETGYDPPTQALEEWRDWGDLNRI